MSIPINLTWGGNFKSVQDEGILEGSAIVFGSEKSPDISSYKDFFTEDTYVHPEDTFTTALYMEHGFSYRKPIGKAIMVKTKDGWIATAQLDMNNPVIKSRFQEIKSGGWGFSTGAVGHVVEREERENDTHFISQWSVGELSITKTPAEPKALIHSVKSLNELYTTPIEPTMIDLEDYQVTDDTSVENLMKIIEMLISEIAKKHVEDFLSPQLEEIKIQLAELKSASLPIGSDEESTQELTVLKSTHEELKISNDELQSSFNEKEALLDENLALLSETQEQLETKNTEFIALEEELTNAKNKVEELQKELDTAKKINLALGKTNFNK